MQVMYENADFSKNGSLLNYLFRLVSGNYKNYELNNNNIYEYLYINILNLLHSKIFSELTKNPEHKKLEDDRVMLIYTSLIRALQKAENL